MDDHEIHLLEAAYEKIWEISERMGLDCFPTHFEVVPPQIMYEFGSYGLPGRFSHWTHGKAYHQMKTMYDYGLSKIYELVINTNPCQAFLMDNNAVIQNTMVMAHVLGHCDFFKNNRWFHNTNRQMTDAAGMNAERIRKYEFEHGAMTVERFLDAALAIQEHVDPNLDLRPRENDPRKPEKEERRATPYDDLWESDEPAPAPDPGKKFPEKPEKDLLYFLAHHSPVLEDWQRDILFIVRNESLYFVPQMQTKIMNEGWACATGDSLLVTEKGFVRFRDLYRERMEIKVAGDGSGAVFPITGFHCREKSPTIRITTRRGYQIEGAPEHRVQRSDGEWMALKDIEPGVQLALAGGANLWPEELVQIPNSSRDPETPSLPETLDENLASLIGAFVVRGSAAGSRVCFRCDDRQTAETLSEKLQLLIGAVSHIEEKHEYAAPHYNLEVDSAALISLLAAVGADPERPVRERDVPDLILQSPYSVVQYFLTACSDLCAYWNDGSVRFGAISERMARTIQLLLLNCGIDSMLCPVSEGMVGLEIEDESALRFTDEIGVSSDEKFDDMMNAVNSVTPYPSQRQRLKLPYLDTVERIEAGCEDVFDITVDVAHSYVANGFVNHNSYWHLRIMREMELTTGDYLEFANLHSGVLSPSPRRINPYYVGLKIFEDIERRWDNPTEKERDEFKRPGGQGREKIFDVREIDSDVSFLRNYLTKELVEDLDLYIYEYRDDEWVIVEKDWRRVRDILVNSMTNFGHPYITVQDGDYRGNRELLLKHHFEGREMDLDYAEKTLRHVHSLWGRKVHLETARPNGARILLSFDGVDNTTTVL